MDLFPDTNFFLHFNHASEIRWADVTGADTVRLLVGRAVSKELDKKKFELRGRPQDRAREYTKKLGHSAATGSPEVLRESGPRVTLNVLAGRPVGWKCPDDLDGGWGDDVLVADALGYRHGHPDADIAILTGDPGLMAKARSHGIGIVALTETDWQLPAENTPEDRELIKLRKENEELKRSAPAISHRVLVAGNETSAVQMAVTSCPRLVEDAIKGILADLTLRHPEQHDARPDGAPSSLAPGATALDLDASPFPVEWTAPSQETVEKYRTAYKDWIRDADRFIRDFRVTEEGPVWVDIEVEIRNSGTRPAEHARVEIEAVGGPVMMKISEGEQEAVPTGKAAERLRPPPTPPRWRRSVKESAVGGSFVISRFAGMAGRFPGFEERSHFARLQEQLGGVSPASGYSAHLRAITEGAVSPAMQAALAPSASFARLAADMDRLKKQGSREDVWRNIGPPVSLPLLPLLPTPRDRHCFYRERVDAKQRPFLWIFSCEEFRHREEPFTARFRLLLPRDIRAVSNAVIRLTLSATNMRDPFKANIPVHISVIEPDMRAMVTQALP